MKIVFLEPLGLSVEKIERECEKFQSCIKWPIVKDEKGVDIVKYQVVI